MVNLLKGLLPRRDMETNMARRDSLPRPEAADMEILIPTSRRLLSRAVGIPRTRRRPRVLLPKEARISNPRM